MPPASPSVRMVLLQGPRPGRLRLLHQPRQPQGPRAGRKIRGARLLFHWKSLRRQVRAEGPVEHGQRGRGRRLFRHAASRDSQLGAWASDQSRPLDSRARRSKRGSRKPRRDSRAQDVPRPPHWSRLSAGPRAASNSGPTARTACTSGGCSPAPATAAGTKACSTREEHRSSPPKAGADRDPRRACQRRAGAVLLVAKGWAALGTGSTAMLGSARRHRARPRRQPRHPRSACGSPPCPPTATIASAMARPRRWWRWRRWS